MLFYRQCKLKKGDIYLTTWIPEQFARAGKFLKLRTDKYKGIKFGYSQPGGCVVPTEQERFSKWDDGWKVIEIGVRKSEKYVLDNQMNYKHQREASDI